MSNLSTADYITFPHVTEDKEKYQSMIINHIYDVIQSIHIIIDKKIFTQKI